MDDKKKKSVARMLASPAALTMLFGAFASNAATMEPVINDSIGIASASLAQTDVVQQQQQQQQQQRVELASAAKPKMLRQLASDIG